MIEYNSTHVRNNFFKVIENVSVNNDITKITSRTGNIVMMSEEQFSSLQETLYLMGIPGMEQSIIEGMNTPASECVEINEL